jgi:alkanesulfonate monooxygenase SsuD/methylene tetrahydromethanopterin reductase-like flavin-dependent oxidoreductase (luciferase family)
VSAPGASAALSADPADHARPFKLGFLTHVHGPGRPAGEVYRNLVETFVAAEELGFDGGWIAQHHLRGDYGRLPSPLVLLGAVAARTRRIELGTAVTVLPLEDPVRLAEDVAVLDAFSGGRVQLGLGSGGANTDAFGAWGLDPARRHEVFDTSLARLRAALAGEPLVPAGPDTAPEPAGGFGSGTADGSAASAARPRLQPARPTLAARLWQATSDPARAAAAAADGDGLLLGTAVHDPLTVQRPLAEAHRAAWTGRRNAANSADGRPPVAVIRAVFPAADRRTARDDLAPALEVHKTAFLRHGLTDLAALTTEEYLARINVHYGHPEEVIADIRADPALLEYATYFVPVVQHEASTPDAEIRRLEIIAREIAPALGWRPAEPEAGGGAPPTALAAVTGADR